MLETKIKIGVIGTGHLGKIHLKLLLEIPQFEVVGFYDASEERRKEISTEFGVKAWNDVEELISVCEAIDIVTPTIYHYQDAVKVLRSQKHLFIEKPVTNTTDEAHSLRKFANEANVKIQIGHVERFNPAFIAASQYELAPMFIETHRLAEFNPRGTDVPVVLDLMIHDIDIMLKVVNANVKKISASGVAVVSDTADIANARIEFDNGCVANLTASRISMKNMRKTRLFQRDSYISIDFLTKQLELLKLSEIHGEPGPLDLVLNLGPNKKPKKIIFNNPEVLPVNAIKEELTCFAQSIIDNTETKVTLDDGIKALEIAYQILEKVEKNLM
ncbi:MAG: Gfo/Idh/MocA family oxidoreductase [Bacteroidetes bacterium]|nr:Gfo/Idh/MocA family oxidoreductase [Bacteroidota bacterium]